MSPEQLMLLCLAKPDKWHTVYTAGLFTMWVRHSVHDPKRKYRRGPWWIQVGSSVGAYEDPESWLLNVRFQLESRKALTHGVTHEIHPDLR